MSAVKLSKQDKQEFAAIGAYEDGMTRVTAFKPNAGGQDKFFRTKKHQIILSGGNKAGKTYCNVMKGALRSIPEKDIHGKNTGWLLDPYIRRRIPPRKIQAWFSTYSQPVQVGTLQPEVERVFAGGKPKYIKDSHIEKGCMHWLETECARINFKWQAADVQSYTGANLDWAGLDEPHDRAIWNEAISRFAATQGYIWITMTPVINAGDADMARKMRYVRWMKEDLVDPFHRDPTLVPQLDVIYADIEENPHVNADFQLSMWAGLTEEERLIRKTGMFFDFIGESAFDADALAKLEGYLRQHLDVSRPRYGVLEYDDREKSDEWKFRFVENRNIERFDDEPGSGFIWKIWEEPIDPQLDTSPDYAIGADPAEGKRGKDYTAAYVKRCDDGRTVAALHGYVDEVELAKQLWLAGNYYCTRTGFVDDAVMGRKPAKLAVESNRQTTLAFLQTGNAELGIGKYGAENLYRQPEKAALARGLATPGKVAGWYTSAATRPMLVTGARIALTAACAAIDSGAPVTITDLGWVREAKTFILSNAGKFEAAPGFYDDRIIANSICDKVVEQVSGRKRVYGPKPEQNRPKDLWYIDEDGEYVFNPTRKKQPPQELWI